MNKNYERINTVWETIMKQVDPLMLKTIRVSIGVPENGFVNDKDEGYINWASNSIKEIRPIIKKYKNFKKLDSEIKKTNYGKYIYYLEFYKQKHTLLKNGFDLALKELIFFNDVSIKTLRSIKLYEIGNYTCNLIRLDKNTALEKGIYIKIGSETTGALLKSFIDDKNKEIKKIQKELYRRKNKTPKKQNFDRKEKIWLVGQLNKDTLKTLLKSKDSNRTEVRSNSKDILACMYLKAEYGIKIDDGTFRKTLSNENIERNNRNDIDIKYLLSVNYF